VLLLVLAGCRHHAAPAAPPTSAASNCDPKFERYTYHPARLVRLKDCVTAVGTVVTIKYEADGDAHVQIHLDPGFQYLMNAANRDVNNPITRGNFIVEPDCIAGPVSQADAKEACTGAVPPPGYPLLKAGAHVAISGPWVLDSGHGHNEIHPVERVAVAP
jgi:hypothetical protein